MLYRVLGRWGVREGNKEGNKEGIKEGERVTLYRLVKLVSLFLQRRLSWSISSWYFDITSPTAPNYRYVFVCVSVCVYVCVCVCV
jgi:hypothetical protein